VCSITSLIPIPADRPIVGRHDVFLSIYESNSGDETQALLHGFNQSMTNLELNHRILSVQDDPGGQWPYSTAPERIEFLAHARNMALEPLQSPDNSIRLPNWQEYTKVIFLNDIVFQWQDIANLIATRIEGEEEGYDMACAMDYGSSGMSVCRLVGKHPDIRSVRHMGCSGYLRRTATRLLALCLRQDYPERSPK
jgi:hypothetical protein